MNMNLKWKEEKSGKEIIWKPCLSYLRWSEKASTPYLLTAYGPVAPAILPAMLAEIEHARD